jgi:guanylate kinase
MTHTDFHIIKPHPLVIVISGPSGVGKDSVLNRMKEKGLPFHFVITATTRPIRDGEVNGKDYFFISTDEFAHMIETNELLEHAIVYNDYKGIPKQQVRDALATNMDVILRIDVQGAASIKKLIPDAILIFLTTEDEQSMVDRLQNRKSETPEGLKLRIATARQEVKKARDFDYVVINYQAELDLTVDVISAIITAEHHKVIQRNVVL